MRNSLKLSTLSLVIVLATPLTFAQAPNEAPANAPEQEVAAPAAEPETTAAANAAEPAVVATPQEAQAAEKAVPPEVEPAQAAADPAPVEEGFGATIDAFFGKLVGWIAAVFFWDILFWDNASPTNMSLPVVVGWLVIGALFFTVRMSFVNVRMFRHAIDVVRGRFDNPEDEGEVTHFQALSAALSATVGLGNIAGVAIAVAVGGPGATFWMIVAGFLGMASKFTECTLGQKYREVRPDGQIMGGAMYYLSKGLEEKGAGALGKVLAVMFAILCVGASFGGGNAFQVNQSLGVVGDTIPVLGESRWLYGLLMTGAVGVVIIGGIKSIAKTAEKIVPLMCSVYVLACLYILVMNAGLVPAAMGKIVSSAMSLDAGFGGLIGVLVVGFKRAAFSNEAGIGSAAIAHSAAKTEYPVREGIVALLEPFIDTIVVCTMTALVIVLTGAYENPAYADMIQGNNGAALTSAAMAEHISWFPYLLTVAVILFAYSTMISWSYYGERCWCWLFGDNASMGYKLLFLVFTFLGSIVTATNVLDLSDLMILGMAFPNILGLYFLSGDVRKDLNDYQAKLASGEIKPYAAKS